MPDNLTALVAELVAIQLNGDGPLHHSGAVVFQKELCLVAIPGIAQPWNLRDLAFNMNIVGGRDE